MNNIFQMGTETIGSKSPASEKLALAAVELAMDRLEDQKKRSSDEFLLGRQEAETDVKMALERARQWESDGFQQIMTANGMDSIRGQHGMDSSTLGWTLQSERTEVWFKLLGQWLARPGFRAFYRTRDKLAEHQSPGRVASGQQDWLTTLSREAFPETLYGRPQGRTVFGSLRAGAVEKFFHERYRPSRISVALVGDITPVQARQWAERYFGSLPAGPPPPAAPLARAKVGEYREVMNAMLSVVGYRRPPQGHPDDAYFDLLESLLTGGTTPYYSTALTKERQLARNVGVTGNFPGDRLERLFLVVASPAAGRTVDQLEAVQIEIVERFAKEPLDEERLEAAVNRVQVEFLRSLQSNEKASVSLAQALAILGTTKGLEHSLNRIRMVTPSEFQKFAQRYLIPENRFVFSLNPAAREKSPVGATR